MTGEQTHACYSCGSKFYGTGFVANLRDEGIVYLCSKECRDNTVGSDIENKSRKYL